MTSFPKSYRLLRPNDFNYLKSGADNFNTPHLRFFFKPSLKSREHSRLGLSVSRKSGNAVQRNYIKRFLREKFRNGPLLNLDQDILVIASPRLKPLFSDKNEVRLALEKSWFKGEGKIADISQKNL